MRMSQSCLGIVGLLASLAMVTGCMSEGADDLESEDDADVWEEADAELLDPDVEPEFYGPYGLGVGIGCGIGAYGGLGLGGYGVGLGLGVGYGGAWGMIPTFGCGVTTGVACGGVFPPIGIGGVGIGGIC